MWKVFIGVVVGMFGGGLVVLLAAPGVLASSETWSGVNARVVSQSSVTSLPPSVNTCYSMMLRVHIRSAGDADACIIGELGKTHLVRYTGANYQYAYAIAIGDETEYTRIDTLCSSLAWCGYSSSSDTFLMGTAANGWRFGTAIIKNFTSHLTYHAFPEPHYSFAYDEPLVTIGRGDSVVLPTGPLAVSPNGKWAVVELQEYGFVRVDMTTGSYRRVVAPGAQYGYGADPGFELSVTNDGRFMAVAGWGGGLTVYEMDGACGDLLDMSSGRYFLQGVIACPMSLIDYPSFFPGFMLAQAPRFSSDGMKLSAFILTRTSVSRATLTPLPATSSPGTPLYVALGDSFVSGEGETDDAFYMLGTNSETNRCHVSTRSYAFLLYPGQAVNASNKSCSGSRIEEALKQHANLATIQDGQPLLTMSIGVGGNDIDVMGKLKTCISPGTCEWALPEKRIQTAQEIKALYPRVVSLLATMRDSHPETKLFFVGYPKVINDSSSANCRAPLSLLLSEQERRYMNETIQYLNEVLAAAAHSSSVPFVDVSDVYEGERLCDTVETAMNGIRAGDDFAPISALGALKMIGAESFHPTPRGHELVAARIREKLAEISSATPCESCGGTPDLTPAYYWREQVSSEGLPRLIADKFLETTVYIKGRVAEFSFPAHSFALNTAVRFEVHSETRLLGEFVSSSSGGLVGKVAIPELESGYHTVHVIGVGASGEAIDRYEVIYSGDEELILNPSIQTDTAGAPPLEIVSSLTPAQSSPQFVRVASVPILETSTGEVKGATISMPRRTMNSAESVSKQEPIFALSWWGVWLICAGICLATAIGAYSIGRRQV